MIDTFSVFLDKLIEIISDFFGSIFSNVSHLTIFIPNLFTTLLFWGAMIFGVYCSIIAVKSYIASNKKISPRDVTRKLVPTLRKVPVITKHILSDGRVITKKAYKTIVQYIPTYSFKEDKLSRNPRYRKDIDLKRQEYIERIEKKRMKYMKSNYKDDAINEYAYVGDKVDIVKDDGLIHETCNKIKKSDSF